MVSERRVGGRCREGTQSQVGAGVASQWGRDEGDVFAGLGRRHRSTLRAGERATFPHFSSGGSLSVAHEAKRGPGRLSLGRPPARTPRGGEPDARPNAPRRRSKTGRAPRRARRRGLGRKTRISACPASRPWHLGPSSSRTQAATLVGRCGRARKGGAQGGAGVEAKETELEIPGGAPKRRVRKGPRRAERKIDGKTQRGWTEHDGGSDLPARERAAPRTSRGPARARARLNSRWRGERGRGRSGRGHVCGRNTGARGRGRPAGKAERNGVDRAPP